MMTMNSKTIQIIAQIVSEIVNQKTVEEIRELSQHGGKMFDEGRLAAEIAVKMFMRLAQIPLETREVSPLDILVDEGEARYMMSFAG